MRGSHLTALILVLLLGGIALAQDGEQAQPALSADQQSILDSFYASIDNAWRGRPRYGTVQSDPRDEAPRRLLNEEDVPATACLSSENYYLHSIAGVYLRLLTDEMYPQTIGKTADFPFDGIQVHTYGRLGVLTFPMPYPEWGWSLPYGGEYDRKPLRDTATETTVVVIYVTRGASWVHVVAGDVTTPVEPEALPDDLKAAWERRQSELKDAVPAVFDSFSWLTGYDLVSRWFNPSAVRGGPTVVFVSPEGTPRWWFIAASHEHELESMARGPDGLPSFTLANDPHEEALIGFTTAVVSADVLVDQGDGTARRYRWLTFLRYTDMNPEALAQWGRTNFWLPELTVLADLGLPPEKAPGDGADGAEGGAKPEVPPEQG
jgi:hypothetical protein